MSDVEDTQLLQAVLKGTVPPPNEYAAFILEQLNKVKETGADVDRGVRFHEVQLEEFRVKQVRLSAITDQYLTDLRRWLQPAKPGILVADLKGGPLETPEIPSAPDPTHCE